ncbi:MAG: aminotransferase class V-fold PLP-dependent enzyme [Sphingobium sp.]|nr:aminotransferase class V-fold PLP-dependent enzyme [Sphingobium sp.]
MTLSRRQAIAAALAAPVAASAARAAGAAAPTLPDKAAFAATPLAYLDNAATHPISLGAQAAIAAYVAGRTMDPAAAARPRTDMGAVLAKFARLVNAAPDEVTWVQSTTMGEQMVLRAMGYPDQHVGKAGGRLVTDTLHFFASFPMYAEMAKQGVDVHWVRDRDGRIDLDDMRRAIVPGTKLVCLSLVSTVNGFRHDLKAVCDMAHGVGALVYADIIHAAGAVPIDLHGSGVDFAACATYKWLMGDFGLGFLYVRREVLSRLPRTQYGFYGFAAPGAADIGPRLSEPQTHVYPFDPPGKGASDIVDYAVKRGAIGQFATGTYSHAVPAQLDHSLDYIGGIGVERIQAHAQALLAPLREELPRRGYRLMTPPGTATPLLACALADAKGVLADPLAKARVRISLSENRFRVSPSVHNDMRDIERLIAALPRL